MISIELLGEVLGKRVIEIIKDQSNIQILPVVVIEVFERRGLNLAREEEHCFNIYELAHKCKEWANKKGYILSSTLHNNQGYCEIKKETPERIKSIAWCPMDFNTEVEAIFSACQYILDNQSKVEE